MIFEQAEFEVRCEWGRHGVLRLAPISDVIVIVDVLSFSTCVDIIINQSAIAFPYSWNDDTASAFAQSVNAELADKRGSSQYSLSPASLLQLPPNNSRLVLPSPNGSSLSLATGQTPTLTGCFRNCKAIAFAAMTYGKRIAIVPAGEHWDDGSLRPAVEDWLGAGAIIHHLQGNLSPEARSALAAYQAGKEAIADWIQQSGSGKELIQRGFTQDVALASALDVSHCVPTLINGAYVNHPQCDRPSP
jgi:2-phosphosulfolactate phosphatase